VFREQQPKLKLMLSCMTPFNELQQIAPFTDVYGFRGDVMYEPFTSFLKAEQAKGKEVWTFTCGTPVADAPAISYWRQRPWWAFKQGMDGIMIFCWGYLVHWEWGASSHVGPVPTIGYEALAQGMEDYALLDMLRQRIAAARQAGRTEAADAAQTVLDTAIADAVVKTGPKLTEEQLETRLLGARLQVGDALVKLVNAGK